MKKLTIILLIFLANFLFAQNNSIGTWREYLPYSDAVSVTEANGLIYCATNSALFTYNKTDFSIDRLNIVNGLSDIELSLVRFNPFNNKIVVVYNNGNIDIIDDNKNITNLSAVKTSNIIGSKKINHIYFSGKLAYLSTGFGIVVLDTDKIEIVETYFFGPLGSSILTNAVTSDGTNLYAATDQGVFVASKNSANLIDFNAWSLMPELGTASYSAVAFFENQLFASIDLPADSADTLYYNNGSAWQSLLDGVDIEHLSVSNKSFSVVKKDGISLFNSSLINYQNIESSSSFFISPNDIFVDENGIFWLADQFSGLIRLTESLEAQFVIPNSPSSSNVFQMDILGDDFWMVSGGENIFLKENLVNHKNKNEWRKMGLLINDANGNVANDMVSVAINPTNSSNVYTGSHSAGVFEYNNDVITNIYNAQNSPLDSTFFGTTASSALAFDTDQNLWITSSFSSNILTVKTPGNEWHTYSFPGKTQNTSFYPALVIDINNNKWVLNAKDNNLIVFNENKTYDDKSDDKEKLLTVVGNSGRTLDLYSITEDKDGEIWVGTDEGVAVFYNVSNLFEEELEAEQIFVEQDGQTQILLESEVVSVITVDGANRKWIGTQTSGVYLMSEDGTQQIEHFTKENSPLLSNNIFDIVIDPESGEVYFGTEKGLISYKGTATEGKADYSNVFVYPNPVKPDYDGVIAIRGLLKDTDVRITDISGNIVFQTTSLGGQAVWDGKDFNGNKVQTGVYMVFNGSSTGEQKAAAKILIYH